MTSSAAGEFMMSGWGRAGVSVAPSGAHHLVDPMLPAVRAASRGEFEPLGEMPRADGAGSVCVGREQATDCIATLRLQRNAGQPNGDATYALGATRVITPVVASSELTEPARKGPLMGQPSPRRATPQEVLVPPSTLVVDEESQPVRGTRRRRVAAALAMAGVVLLAGYGLRRRSSLDATRATATLILPRAQPTDSVAAVASHDLANSARIEVAAELPADARVTVNGIPLPAGIITVPPGSYAFRVTAPGFVDVSEHLTVRAGETMAWTPLLLRESATRAARPAVQPRSAAPAVATSVAPMTAAPPVAPAAQDCAALFAAKDWAHALPICTGEADGGNAQAARLLATMYDEGLGESRDSRRAFTLFRRAAALGDADAQFRIAKAYEKGTGLPRDVTEALAWYRKAADQGHARARNYLGWLYGSGTGVARDDAKAVRWFQLAAAQGDAQAEYNLGFMYANGRGVRRDDARAVVWFRRAARGGYHDAIAELQRRHISP